MEQIVFFQLVAGGFIGRIHIQLELGKNNLIRKPTRKVRNSAFASNRTRFSPQYREPARTRFVNEKVIKIALRDPVCVYSGRFLTQ